MTKRIDRVTDKAKNSIRDVGTGYAYTAYTVDTVDMVYNADMVYNVDTVYTIQTALHC